MEEALHRTGLREELEAIHFANRLYWNLANRSPEDDMEHLQRQERLIQVRKEYYGPETLNQEWVEYWNRHKE
jgi:hypothetical protein